MNQATLGLIVETSTERGVVAVFDGTTCVFEEKLPVGLQNSQLVLPIIDQKIKENLFQLSDLSFIGVGVGPGSYTGIRVGAVVAKTLAFALQIPVIGICTLDAFIPQQDGLFAALIDAKIGGIYMQAGRLVNGRVGRELAAGAYPLAEAAEKLEKIPTLVTPNATKILPRLCELKTDAQWHVEERYPDASFMMAIALQKMASEDYLDEQALELLYLRKTQAEIEREDLA